MAGPPLAKEYTRSEAELTVLRGASAGVRKRTAPRGSFVKMAYFSIDFKIEMPYPLAPPQGLEAFLIFEK
jgi:hypothetical protein